MSTTWDPVDFSLPGLSVHGILQARILEWIAIPFSKYTSLDNLNNIINTWKPEIL